MDHRRSRKETFQKGSSKDRKSENFPQLERNHLLQGKRHQKKLISHQEKNIVRI